MLTKSHFVEPLPIMLKLLEVCQETQTDIKGLKQKVDILENLVKQRVENQTINADKSFKSSKNNVDWIEVCIIFIIIFSVFTNYIINQFYLNSHIGNI